MADALDSKSGALPGKLSLVATGNKPHRLHRIAKILIAEWVMIRPQSTPKAQMKTLLMLIVGLMLAGCGSMENHVRNRDAVDHNRYLVAHTAVDTLCACP
ncbi:MAG TPA: hypothetical protein VGI59_06545 [Candidatus Udaeobacter sp.]